MIVVPPDPDQVSGHAADMYRRDREEDGLVYGHTRAMAVNPEAHVAFEALVRAVVASIGPRVFELATLGAALGIGSEHCLLAHGRKVLRAGMLDEDGLARLASDYREAGLSPAETAVVAYAHRLSTDASSMTDEDSRTLREAGFTDRQVVDITLAAAARNYYSRTLQALAVPVDEVPGLGAELAGVLRTGSRRPAPAGPDGDGGRGDVREETHG